MNSNKYFFYLFALIMLVIGFQTVKTQDECEERQAKAEYLLRILLRIDKPDEFRPITTDEQFSQYCKRAKEGLIMFKAYGKCLNGISKQIYSILKSTGTKALRNYCVINRELSREYLSCFADTRLTIRYRKCLFKLGETLNYAAEVAEEDEIFSSLCCGFNRLSSCLDSTFQSNGACTDPNINLRSYSKTFVKGLFGSVSDAFCSSYSESFCAEKQAKMDSFSEENKITNQFAIVANLIKLSEKLAA